MTRAYCDLDRQFFELSTYDSTELNRSDSGGKRFGWPRVLENSLSVIVAPANYGKTTEMTHKAKELRASGSDAVFLPLRLLVEAGSVEEALDTESRKSYQHWKSSQGSMLSLFIDSLDEAVSFKKEQIDFLLNRILKEVGEERSRINWIISTRPAILNDVLLSKIASILDYPLPGKQRKEGEPSKKNRSVEETTTAVQIEVKPREFKLYKMAPLDGHQGAIYLKSTRPEIEADALISLAMERGLSGFCRNPGGLDIIARIQLLKSPPESLTEIYERVFLALTENIAADERFVNAGRPSQEQLVDVLEKIASATQVCRLLNIELPDVNTDPDDAILSARRLATPKLTEQVLQALLSTQSFVDSHLHQVKMYPDELPPFLAARRLSTKVNSAEEALRLIRAFSWTSPTGEKGVHKEYFLLMGWLATLNRHCRSILIELDPQVLAFFGDLRNPDVPLSDARRALHESIRRLVELGDELGRGLYYLTSENYWAAAPDRLSADIESLYRKYKHHPEARSVLLQMAAASKNSLLRKNLLESHRNDYRAILEDSDEVSYLVSIGEEQDALGMAAALVNANDVTESMVRSVLPALGWAYFTPRDVVKIIRRLSLGDQGYFGLSFIFEHSSFVRKASEEQRFQLCQGLLIPLIRNKDFYADDEFKCLRVSEDYGDITKAVFVGMVQGATVKTRDKVCRLALLLQRATFGGHLHQFNNHEIWRAFDENAFIRREYLKILLAQKSLDERLKWLYVIGHFGIARFSEEDRKAVLSKKNYIEAQKKQELMLSDAEKLRASENVPSKKPRERMSEQHKSEFKSNRRSIRAGKDIGSLILASQIMMIGASLTKYGDADFSRFEEEAGEEIAKDVLVGMGKIWRSRLPRFDEDKPDSTYYVTVVGLQGLCIELGRGLAMDTLSHSEVRHALAYAKFEMNNYPKWFWPLVHEHPKLALEELTLVAKGHSAGKLSRAHAERLFSFLKEAPESIQRELLTEAWSYIKSGASVGVPIAERVLVLMSDLDCRPRKAEFQSVVWKKLKGVTFPDELKHSLNGVQEEAVMWASQWLILFPKEFHEAMMSLGDRDEAYARILLGRITSYFGHGYGASLSRVANSGSDGIKALEFLRIVAKWAVPEAGDIKRVSGRVYSPNPRDHAERARDKILSILANANSQAAYQSLLNLTEGAVDGERRYIRKLMFEMREREYVREPVPQIDYAKFEENLQPIVTDSIAFSMAVHADLETVKYDIEQGEHSLRSFFSEVDFSRVNKGGVAGEKSGLAMEEHFQILLASEMSHHAKGRYSVSLEAQTAEKKRRDIQCSKRNWRASIEVKMSERWTLEMYVEALEDQLVGQYMRHRNANTGFLVLVLQKARKWKTLDGKSTLTFDDVISFLQRRAIDLLSDNPEYYLRVIGINAVPPSDFRKKSKR